MQKLSLTDDEYGQLFEQIANKKYISQIGDNSEFQIGNKTIKGAELKQAILDAQDFMLSNNGHSEANLYNAKIGAFVAKVDNISDIPEEYLKFARENNLPIYIIGR